MDEERMGGGGTMGYRMMQFKYGAGVPVAWSVWCNDHRAQLQCLGKLKINLKLRQVKVRSGEHCSPTTWGGHSHNAPGCWRTYAVDVWHQSRTRATWWIPQDGWQEWRSYVLYIWCTHSIDCGRQWPARSVPRRCSLTLTQCQRRTMI